MSAQKARKKKKKIKVHYDRLFAQLILLCLLVFLCVWLFSLCSSDDSPSDGSREASREAVEAAIRDADKVINTAPGSWERDNTLLFIRAREHRLRSKGYGHAADDYINAARQHLERHGIK